MSTRQAFSSNDNIKSSQNQLSKLYRLYSPENKFRPTENHHKKNKPQQPPVIELIFNHPHLLFMQAATSSNNNLTEKHALAEFNIVKNIVQRKKQLNLSNKSQQINKKPMTAPSIIKRKKYTQLNLSTEPQQTQTQQKNQINPYNFNEFTQINTINNAKDNFSSHSPSHRIKPKTSVSKGKRNSRQNIQQPSNMIEKVTSYRNPIRRNTFDSCLEQKRKSINFKYQQDKILRQNLYQTNNPMAQMYVNVEAKFAKFVKKHH